MTGIGSPAWLEERSGRGAAHHGEAAAIDVVVAGGPDGTITYHVALDPGSPPRFEAGAAPGGAAATLEMTWADATAEDRGELDPVVAYMRGTAKTKGATRPLYDLFHALHRGRTAAGRSA
jgi:hypothetical protein